MEERHKIWNISLVYSKWSYNKQSNYLKALTTIFLHPVLSVVRSVHLPFNPKVFVTQKLTSPKQPFFSIPFTLQLRPRYLKPKIPNIGAYIVHPSASGPTQRAPNCCNPIKNSKKLMLYYWFKNFLIVYEIRKKSFGRL